MASEFDITTIPTFCIVDKNKILETYSGSDKNNLEKFINKYSTQKKERDQ